MAGVAPLFIDALGGVRFIVGGAPDVPGHGEALAALGDPQIGLADVAARGKIDEMHREARGGTDVGHREAEGVVPLQREKVLPLADVLFRHLDGVPVILQQIVAGPARLDDMAIFVEQRVACGDLVLHLSQLLFLISGAAGAALKNAGCAPPAARPHDLFLATGAAAAAPLSEVSKKAQGDAGAVLAKVTGPGTPP